MTPREHKALAFIETFIADAGYPPSIAEIAQHLGLAARAGAHPVLVSLERQGRIVRDPRAKRGTTVLRGVAAAGSAVIADVLASVSTPALRAELHRREETDRG